MKRVSIAALLSICIFSIAARRGQESSKTFKLNECDSKMSESACDSKIQQDLAVAIRNNPQECHYEPSWRPSSSKERTLHVNKVNGATVTVFVDGEIHNFKLGAHGDDACRDSGKNDCSHWQPEVGRDYPATISNQPTYLNSCLHRVLRAKREVCIGFGQLKEETLPYGVSRTAEFTACYSLPPGKGDQ
jgi:hypothetical protein